jgi:thiamine biosynthesis lipoprotein
MSRFETWLSHAATIVVTLSGVVYLWMKYFMESDDPFSVVNHPLQPAMLSIHIIAAPLLVFVLGLILNSHIRKKLSSPSSYNRRSGLISLVAFPAMVVSGYLLQVTANPTVSRIALILHLVSSGLFAFTYIVHQMFGMRIQAVLKAAGVLALTFGLLTAGFSQDERVEVIRQVHLMGTEATLITWAADRETGLTQLEDFIRILEETEAELSTWRKESVLTRLNEHPVGQPFALRSELVRLFEDLFFWNMETLGAFDPAIGRLTDAWDIHGAGRIPSDQELDLARRRSGMRHLQLDSVAGRLVKQADITIDVGAFGKGEGLDRVVEDAGSEAASPFLINLGGQIIVGGSPGKVWTLDLAHPGDRSRGVLTVELTSGSISTSAGSERDLHVGGRRVGHHLDPQTGQPIVSGAAVSVWHMSGLVADTLSTALYVMGPDEGLRWAEDRQIAATFMEPSPGGGVTFRSTTEWAEVFSKKPKP